MDRFRQLHVTIGILYMIVINCTDTDDVTVETALFNLKAARD